MSDNRKSIDIITEEAQDGLTEKQKSYFALNDRIFDIHVEFDARIKATRTMDELQGVVAEFTGPYDAIGTCGRFKDLLDEINSIEDDHCAMILAKCFENMQTKALSRFDEESSRIEAKVYN
jgi:hypothetical protein